MSCVQDPHQSWYVINSATVYVNSCTYLLSSCTHSILCVIESVKMGIFITHILMNHNSSCESFPSVIRSPLMCQFVYLPIVVSCVFKVACADKIPVFIRTYVILFHYRNIIYYWSLYKLRSGCGGAIK